MIRLPPRASPQVRCSSTTKTEYCLCTRPFRPLQVLAWNRGPVWATAETGPDLRLTVQVVSVANASIASTSA
jgi:hypothetical protein